MNNTLLQLLGLVCLSVPVTRLAFQLWWSRLRRRAIEKQTVLNEIPYLGHGRPEGKLRGTVVIAGGSFAGLVAARVCSDFFDDVVIVEPDELTPDGKRTRIPQLHQSHGLLAIGLPILRALFPTIDDVARSFDARVMPADAHITMGKSHMLYEEGTIPERLTCSRICLEYILQKLVLPLPNIRHVRGLVQGFVPSKDGKRIQGVVIKAGDDKGSTETIQASLFLDCSGSSTGALRWLEKSQGANWEQPKKISYDPIMTYVTTTVPIPERIRDVLPLLEHPEYTGGYSNLTYLKALGAGRDKDPRGVMIYRVENDRMMMTAAGWGIPLEELPTTLSQFIDLFDELYRKALDGGVQEHIMDTLKMLAKALDEDGIEAKFITSRMTSCYLIDYESAKSMPTNFAALGDAILRVDPVYGQGIAKAMMDGASLNGALRACSLEKDDEGYPILGSEFQRLMVTRQLPRTKECWDSSRLADYGRPTTIPAEGETLEMGDFERKYGDALFRLSGQDPYIGTVFGTQIQFMRPSLDLLHPYIFFRALWNMWVHKG